MRRRTLLLITASAASWVALGRPQSLGQLSDTVDGLLMGRADLPFSVPTDCSDAVSAASAVSRAEARASSARLDARLSAADEACKLKLRQADLRAELAGLSCLEGALPPSGGGTDLDATVAAVRDRIQRLQSRLEVALQDLSNQASSLEQSRADEAASSSRAARAEAQLQVATRQIAQAREQADAFHWAALRARAERDLCQEGNTRRREACQASLSRSLDQAASRWLACARAGDAPDHLHTDRPDARWPAPALRLAQDADRSVWLLLCDPTLPESSSHLGGPE